MSERKNLAGSAKKSAKTMKLADKEPRQAKRTELDLRKDVKKLTSLAKEIKAIADALPRSADGEEFAFVVDGQTKLNQAVSIIRTYIGNVTRGISLAKGNGANRDTD